MINHTVTKILLRRTERVMGYHPKGNGPDPLLDWMRSKELTRETIKTRKIIKAQSFKISRNCSKGKKQMSNLFATIISPYLDSGGFTPDDKG